LTKVSIYGEKDRGKNHRGLEKMAMRMNKVGKTMMS
jgi:hypothetical protein